MVLPIRLGNQGLAMGRKWGLYGIKKRCFVREVREGTWGRFRQYEKRGDVYEKVKSTLGS